MKLCRMPAVLLVVGACLACTTTDSAMNSWVGHPADDLVALWGAPDSRISLENGGAVYTWISVSQNHYGVTQCRQSFNVDSKGVITGWSYSGCPKVIFR